MSEPDQQTNGLSNEPDPSKRLKNNIAVDSNDVKLDEEKQDPTGQILESVINKNDTPQKESDEKSLYVIPEVASAVVNNTENNGNSSSVIPEVVSSVVNNSKPIEEPIKDTASAKVISNVVSDVINPNNNIGNEVVEPSNENPPNENINENINIEESDYDKEFYVYIIYYNDQQIPVVIGNKTTKNEKLQFPIYMINNKEGVDRIGYFQFDNEDGLYEDDSNNKIILNATRLTNPIFYNNIADTIKRKSDPKKYTNNEGSPSNVNVDQLESTGSPITTWFSIKIENPGFTYNLNNENTQINNTQLYQHKILGDGNCFFTAVAQAFYTIGITTDATKIKEFLYKNLTDEIKEMYLNFYNTCKNLTDDTELFNSYDCNNIRSSFEFNEGKYKKTFDEGFKDFFMSNNCWANDMTIALLSKLLKITFLIHTDTSKMEEYENYILLEYSNGNHYDLILQKTDDKYKGIFTKDELTPDIKKYFSIN